MHNACMWGRGGIATRNAAVGARVLLPRLGALDLPGHEDSGTHRASRGTALDAPIPDVGEGDQTVLCWSFSESVVALSSTS